MIERGTQVREGDVVYGYGNEEQGREDRLPRDLLFFSRQFPNKLLTISSYRPNCRLVKCRRLNW
jgi:hypothetical protein